MTDEKPTSAASPMSFSTAVSTEEEAVVAAYGTPLEAELARGRLESEGIAARISDGNTVSIAQHLSPALGGVKVVVGRSDFEAARAILTAPGLASEDDEDGSDQPQPGSLAAGALSADQLANRALRAAVLGLVVVPPVGHLWSLVLLASALRHREALTAKGKRQAAIAVVVDAGVLGIAAWVLAQL